MKSREFIFSDKTKIKMESKYFRGAWPSWEWYFKNVRKDKLPEYEEFKKKRLQQCGKIPNFNGKRNG